MTLQDYAIPVHKSFHQPDLLLGVPKSILALVVCVTIIFMYLLGFVYGLAGPLLYIPCYLISRNDPYLLNFVLENLAQVDYLEG
jgi:type IV secretory pathway VirB3-like protein